MSNFESVRKFMETFGQEVKKAEFPNENYNSLRYELIKEELKSLRMQLKKKILKKSQMH